MSDFPIAKHGTLKRRGLPTITGPMRDVLIQLRGAGDSFVALPDVDSRTIRALENRDWIVVSPPHLDSTYYKITGRGLQALKVYLPTVKRSDGMCPRCEKRQRATRSTGKSSPYCQECMNQLGRRTYRLGLYRRREGGLCTRCHKRPCYVASTGRVYCFCQHCKNLKSRQRHKHQRRDLYIRIIAGEHIACCRSGCDRPRLVTGESVQEYCREHYHEYRQNLYQRKTGKAG